MPLKKLVKIEVESMCSHCRDRLEGRLQDITSAQESWAGEMRSPNQMDSDGLHVFCDWRPRLTWSAPSCLNVWLSVELSGIESPSMGEPIEENLASPEPVN